MDNREFNEVEELDDEIRDTVNGAIEQSKAAKGEVTTFILMNLHNIFEMASQGDTTAEICEKLGLNVRTFNKIKANNKQLQVVYKAAEQAKLEKVKKALYQMTQPRMIKQHKVLSNGKIVEYMETVQPDASLLKYYLNNKSEGEYRDKQEVDIRKVEFVVEIIDDEAPVVENVDYQVVDADEPKK